MGYDPPTPSADLSTDFVDILAGYAPEQLRDVARYAEALAEHKERQAGLEMEPENNEVEDTTGNEKRLTKSNQSTRGQQIQTRRVRPKMIGTPLCPE